MLAAVAMWLIFIWLVMILAYTTNPFSILKDGEIRGGFMFKARVRIPRVLCGMGKSPLYR